MILIAGVILGALVCVFGMWAFLRGQSSMLELSRGAKPSLFGFPAALTHQPAQSDLSGQLREMIKEPQAGRGV